MGAGQGPAPGPSKRSRIFRLSPVILQIEKFSRPLCFCQIDRSSICYYYRFVKHAGTFYHVQFITSDCLDGSSLTPSRLHSNSNQLRLSLLPLLITINIHQYCTRVHFYTAHCSLQLNSSTSVELNCNQSY